MNLSLGDRIKEFYENRTKVYLNRRTITIIRLDGKGFSKFTKNLNKPFDDGFSDDMDATAAFLCENIQGARFAYTQSDEISVVLCDYENQESSAWFDYSVQKMTSIAASLATAKFNQLRLLRTLNESDTNNSLYLINNLKLAFFDARVFQVPTVDEMVNAMIFRQQDCTRNSISMAASANFSHKALEGKSGNDKQEMLFSEKGINWNDYLTKYKRGSVILKETYIKVGEKGNAERTRWVPVETPIFTQDKDFLINLMPSEN
jgi:tRNA(His) 5'-end guanylyltransferase